MYKIERYENPYFSISTLDNEINQRMDGVAVRLQPVLLVIVILSVVHYYKGIWNL